MASDNGSGGIPKELRSTAILGILLLVTMVALATYLQLKFGG